MNALPMALAGEAKDASQKTSAWVLSDALGFVGGRVAGRAAAVDPGYGFESGQDTKQSDTSLHMFLVLHLWRPSES